MVLLDVLAVISAVVLFVALVIVAFFWLVLGLAIFDLIFKKDDQDTYDERFSEIVNHDFFDRIEEYRNDFS